MPLSGVHLPYLRAWREWKGIKQKDLSEAAHITVATISRIEHGNIASFDTIDKLAAALGLKKEELMHQKPGEQTSWAA